MLPGPTGIFFPPGDFELSVAAERNHILAAWSAMPVFHVASGRTVKFGAVDRKQLGYLGGTAGCELQFHFFGMCLIVRACEEPGHEYGFVCLSQHHAILGEVRADGRNGYVSYDCTGREREHKP